MVCPCGVPYLNRRRVRCAICQASRRSQQRSDRAIAARVERRYQAARRLRRAA